LESVSFKKEFLNISLVDEISLSSLLFLNNIQYEDINWTSSDIAVAKIENGNLIPIKIGSIIITATHKFNKNISAKLNVTIQHNEVKSIKITNVPEKIVFGNSYTFKYELNPLNASNVLPEDIIWSSSNNSIVNIDSKGKLDLKGVGEVNIIASIRGSNIKDEINININPITPDSIIITYDKKEEYFPGDQIELKYTIFPESLNKNHYNVKWSIYYPPGSQITNSWEVNEAGLTTAKDIGYSYIKAEIEGFDINGSVLLFSNPETVVYRLNESKLDQNYLKNGIKLYNYVSSPMTFKPKSKLDYSITEIEHKDGDMEFTGYSIFTVKYSIKNNSSDIKVINELAQLVMKSSSQFMYIHTIKKSKVDNFLKPREEMDFVVGYRVLKPNTANYFLFRTSLNIDGNHNMRVYFK
jgi:hypothetical protein